MPSARVAAQVRADMGDGHGNQARARLHGERLTVPELADLEVASVLRAADENRRPRRPACLPRPGRPGRTARSAGAAPPPALPAAGNCWVSASWPISPAARWTPPGGQPRLCHGGWPPRHSWTGYGSCHCWLAPPLQLYRMSCVPFAVLEPGSSRHLPEAGLTSCPPLACHCWLAPPLQVHHSTSVPLL